MSLPADYDAWKTRSPDDELARSDGPGETCEDCGDPLPALRWAQWCDGVMIFFCDDCAEEREKLRDE